MTGHDDPLAAEREEQAAIRWDHEPRGRVIRGTYYEDAPSRNEAEADR